MKINDSSKAVFLPVCEKVLCQYKGYVLEGKMRPDLNDDEVYYLKEVKTRYEHKGISRKIIGLILVLPMLPFIIIGAIIDTYNNDEKYLTILENGLSSFFAFIYRKKDEISYDKCKKEKYDDVLEEDIPDFIKHCQSHFAKIYLYSYTELTENDKSRINELTQNGIIHGIQVIDRLTDLSSFIIKENISVHNSFLVLLSGDSIEVNEAKALGFDDMLMSRNFELWAKRDFNGENSIKWNSKETLKSMKEYVFHYIHAKDNVYFDNKTVIFIEEDKDEFLNKYISTNYESLCQRFKGKGMHFIYFPALKSGLSNLPEEIYPYLKLRIPILYSLGDNEIKELIAKFIENIDEESFVRLCIEPLELPYFKRPCLLRSLSGGWKFTENRFTYKPLIYKSEDDLNNLFDQYFSQLAIPNDADGVRYSRAKPPEEYDADFYFYRDAFQEEQELKEKIDQLKAQGNYGVIAEAIIYMLATLKNLQPELLQKIQPLLEGKNLEEKAHVLSPIYIDKHYRIFLPLYGNREIKLHALPKTVYILFLRHPEGIRFKELDAYKNELMEIYAEISPKSDVESMRKSIDDLVDCTNPSLNQKCSRIRQEIISIIDLPLAKSYYIDGFRGEERKINIDPSYIQFE